MRIKMHRIISTLTICLVVANLAACVGINKNKQNIAIYDFGLSGSIATSPLITSTLLIEEPIAAETLNNNKIRYRLNYDNPSRVFFYTESRWAATPLELLSGKLSMINITPKNTNCSLKFKIEAFDHVFQTTSISEGVVQLSALLIDKNTHKIITSQLITESTPSHSSNAEGGTAAIHQASENALKKVINWGNTMSMNSNQCN